MFRDVNKSACGVEIRQQNNHGYDASSEVCGPRSARKEPEGGSRGMRTWLRQPG